MDKIKNFFCTIFKKETTLDKEVKFSVDKAIDEYIRTNGDIQNLIRKRVDDIVLQETTPRISKLKPLLFKFLFERELNIFKILKKYEIINVRLYVLYTEPETGLTDSVCEDYHNKKDFYDAIYSFESQHPFVKRCYLEVEFKTPMGRTEIIETICDDGLFKAKDVEKGFNKIAKWMRKEFPEDLI